MAKRMRIEKLDYGSPGLIKIEAVADNAQDYISEAVGVAGLGSDPSEIQYVGPSRLYLMDSAMLRDTDNDPGFYVAACGYFGSWPGAVFYRSTDGGGSYAHVAGLPNEAVAGVALTALASGPVNVFDEGGSVDIAVFNGNQLFSASEINVLNGSNAALLGDDGRWEVIQWKTATLISTGRYRLSGLLRGRRGTDWAIGTHVAGDKFIQASTVSWKRPNFGASDIGLTRYYKAVTVGYNLQQSTSQALSNDAVGLKPYSPVHIAGSRDGSDNLTITWIRRTRIGGEWRDKVDASLGEDSEEYEVDIYDGASVVRTISGLASATATYTAAQQTTDFGSPQASVHVKVYQISATVDRGYAGDATI